MIEQTIRINYLLDFYNTLLTDKQKYTLEMYYQEDLSLVEIAENLEVSRQAIHDLLKRGEALLEDYENNLKLYGKYLNRRKKSEDLLQYIQTNIENETVIAKISKELLEIIE